MYFVTNTFTGDILLLFINLFLCKELTGWPHFLRISRFNIDWTIQMASILFSTSDSQTS